MAEIVLTKDNFEAEVLNSEIPVLVDFWAEWCGPCQMLSPIVAEIAKEYDGRIKVGKLNVDDNESLAVKYRINAIPALKLFKNGKVEKDLVGYMSKELLLDKLGL